MLTVVGNGRGQTQPRGPGTAYTQFLDPKLRTYSSQIRHGNIHGGRSVSPGVRNALYILRGSVSKIFGTPTDTRRVRLRATKFAMISSRCVIFVK